jgi:uncharacterized lipoprotein YddW (UPF0748 family)
MKADGVRRLAGLCGALLLAAAGAARAAAAGVSVVYGEESVAPSERAFAQSLAHHAVRWYRDAGVTVCAGADTNLDLLLSPVRVAVLIHVAGPSAQRMATLRRFVQRGGRLIVCYSSSPALAELMGVAPVGYVKGDTSGRWSAMRFDASRPQGVPERVVQSSPNLFLVRPVAGASQNLAWWEDRLGRRTPEPAWLATRHGYWMTHVLLADGDEEAKSQLLLALAASCDPSLWQPAAAGRLAAAERVGPFRGAASAARPVRRVADTARRAAAQAAARAAAEAEAGARNARSAGRGFAAWTLAGDLRRHLEFVYGWMQAPRAGEVRGVWDHSGMGLYPGDWPRTCDLLRSAGFSDLYVCAGGPGFSHYRSGVLPPSRIYLEQGDQLAACLAAARPRGLRVHAWLFCFNPDQATEDRQAVFRRRGWVLAGEDGRERRWLDPSAADLRAMLVQAGRELATRYAVDGVHLDYVRYADFSGSLGPAVRRSFEAASGRNVADWPAGVKPGGARYEEFAQWRCDQVTALVADLRTLLRREAPGRLLTAAVYGKYPSCVGAVGQDWTAWLRQGYVDYLMPMNYTTDLERFRELVGRQTSSRWMRRRMLPGIGVTAAESRLGAAAVIDQILAVREADAPGFVLYDLDNTLQQEILPVLKVGITAE